MTNEPIPGGAMDPGPPQGAAAPAGGVAPQGGSTLVGAKKSGGRGAILIVGGIIAFLAIVLFVVRNSTDAGDLRVGDCFSIPDGTTVQTVERSACTETHNAEVIFVGEYDGTSFPISLSLDSYIQDNCVPAFETYVGRPIDSDPELSVGYFHPTRDGWDGGDRTITCYISQPDEGPMTQSLKA